MSDDYQLLQVRSEGDSTIAVVPVISMDSETDTAFRSDCKRLGEQASTHVVLDLRQVESITGRVISQIVELHQSLTQRSLRMKLQISTHLSLLCAVLRLEKLMEIQQPLDS